MEALRDQISAAAARGYSFYVYTLSDAAGVFYVGKGTRGRVLTHGARHDRHNARKLERLQMAGAAVDRRVVAFFQTEAAAYVCEREWIRERRATLTNVTNGGRDAREAAQARARLDAQRFLELRRRLPEWLHWFVDAIIDVTTREAENPTPTRILVRHDRSSKELAW